MLGARLRGVVPQPQLNSHGQATDTACRSTEPAGQARTPISANARENGSFVRKVGFAEVNVHADARRPMIHRGLVCRSES